MTSLNDSPDDPLDDKKRARQAALDFLIRREHTVRELLQKVGRKGLDPLIVEDAVAELTDEGLQSDERYAETVVDLRIRQGKGPLHILHGLKQCGVASALAHAALAEADADWRERAITARRKRFGLGDVDGAKDHARQMRFLLARGFEAEDAHAALKARDTDTDTDQ